MHSDGAKWSWTHGTRHIRERERDQVGGILSKRTYYVIYDHGKKLLCSTTIYLSDSPKSSRVQYDEYEYYLGI